MVSNTYKNYKQCSCCGLYFPVIRTFFKRSFRKDLGKEVFHDICKNCEQLLLINKEWRHGKLLCHKCNQYKDVECFSANGSNNTLRSYRRYKCKDCCNKRNRELQLSLNKELALFKCLLVRFLAARDRAIKSNIEFNITIEYLFELWEKQQGKCALSGIQMTHILLNGRTPTNVSIDKIDSTKGYVIGNTQLVCMACNLIKSDLTIEEMYNFCKEIVKTYEKNLNNLCS